MTAMRWIALSLCGLFVAAPLGAQDNAAPASVRIIAAPGSDAYGSPYGEWRGLLRYSANQDGQPLPGALSVVPTTLVIDRHGVVSGQAPDNGCRLSGSATPGVTANMLNLALTLSGCRHADFNRSLRGSLVVDGNRREAQFWLPPSTLNPQQPGISYEVKGRLRR